MSKRPTFLCLALGLLAAAAPSVAQDGPPARDPRPYRYYFLVTPFADIERASHTSVPILPGSSLRAGGDTTGLGIGAGAFVTPRWSLELELSARRWIDDGMIDNTPPPGGVNGTVSSRLELNHRMDSGTALLAFHPSHASRIRLAYALGLTFMRLYTVNAYSSVIRQGDQIYHTDSRVAVTEFVMAPALQIEASVPLSRRLSLVPYFRAAAFVLDETSYSGTGVFVFQPGAALRFAF